MTTTNPIGTLGESALHASLKAHYARPGDLQEVALDGYIVDILRGEQVIEIQTRNLGGLRPKLAALLPIRPVTLIHPLPALKWILRVDRDGAARPPRRSPKQARAEDAFRELMHLADLLPHPNLTVCLAFVEMEEVWLDDGGGSWRRKGWSIAARRLLNVVSDRRFKSFGDYAALLPARLPEPFTNAQLAASLRIPASLAGKISWTLARAGTIELAGRQGRAHLFRRVV
ncbi:MAG: hypothetical protein HYZ26_10005 [Chloroflexi bacterium]|nr:hypothetical protein [Chloroflexota bacterium]